MLDQTFSARNFRRIYDAENRRGHNVDKAFFPLVVVENLKISAKTEEIREARRTNAALSKEQLKAILQPLSNQLTALRAARDGAVDQAIEQVVESVISGNYQVELVKRSGPGGLSVYSLPNDAEAYFIGKQLQANMAKLYGLQPGDRHAIVNQVRDILSSKFKAFVVRTDIESFYENIDRGSLLREVENDQLLSRASKVYIRRILKSYETLSGAVNGLPRGTGISAYLSELYMRSVDDAIRDIDGLSYYARYVDDIIAIFSPTAADKTSKYLGLVDSAVKAKQLSLNDGKTEYGEIDQVKAISFDFLGYTIAVAGGSCQLHMGQKRYARYKRRLDSCFNIYAAAQVKDQKHASRDLLSRIKFLTGNTRLVNNKRHAYVGVYFTNSKLTNFGKLVGLDAYLSYLTQSVKSQKLKLRLSGHSFEKGFQQKTFYRYSTKELAKIVEAWRYET